MLSDIITLICNIVTIICCFFIVRNLHIIGKHLNDEDL